MLLVSANAPVLLADAGLGSQKLDPLSGASIRKPEGVERVGDGALMRQSRAVRRRVDRPEKRLFSFSATSAGDSLQGSRLGAHGLRGSAASGIQDFALSGS